MLNTPAFYVDLPTILTLVHSDMETKTPARPLSHSETNDLMEQEIQETIKQCAAILRAAHIKVPDFTTDEGLAEMVRLMDDPCIELEIAKDIEDYKGDLAEMEEKVRKTKGRTQQMQQRIDIIERRIEEFEDMEEKSDELKRNIALLEKTNSSRQEILDTYNHEHAELSQKLFEYHSGPSLERVKAALDDAHLKREWFIAKGEEKLKSEVEEMKQTLATVDFEEEEEEDEVEKEAMQQVQVKDYDQLITQKHKEIEALECQLNPSKVAKKIKKQAKDLAQTERDYSHDGFESIFSTGTEPLTYSQPHKCIAPVSRLSSSTSSLSSSSLSSSPQTNDWQMPRHGKKKPDPITQLRASIRNIPKYEHICNFFAEGCCKAGKRCGYNHAPQILVDLERIVNYFSTLTKNKNICIRNIIGTCKFKESCNKYHHPLMNGTGTLEQKCTALYKSL